MTNAELKALRLKAGLKQWEAADCLCISLRHYQALEKDKLITETIAKLAKLTFGKDAQ